MKDKPSKDLQVWKHKRWPTGPWPRKELAEDVALLAETTTSPLVLALSSLVFNIFPD